MSSLAVTLVGSTCLRSKWEFRLLDGAELLAVGRRTVAFRHLMPGSVSLPLSVCLRSRSGFHAVFRAAGLATAPHRRLTGATPGAVWEAAGQLGGRVRVLADQGGPSGAVGEVDAGDRDGLARVVRALGARADGTVWVEQVGPGDRLWCLLQAGRPLVAVAATSSTPDGREDGAVWQPAVPDERDVAFLAAVGQVLPGLSVLDVEFVRGPDGTRTVLDASLHPQIDRYFAADPDATRAAVDRIVCHELEQDPPTPYAPPTPVTAELVLTGPATVRKRVADVLHEELATAGVGIASSVAEDGGTRTVVTGDAERIAAACAETMARHGDGNLCLTCRPHTGSA